MPNNTLIDRRLSRSRDIASTSANDVDTDAAWEQWGRRDPYYGVLADPKFRAADITPAARAEFFESGRRHVEFISSSLRRFAGADTRIDRVLDFGCGVGRLLIPFAALAKEVVGLDVSASMLAEARRNCDEAGLTNVSLVVSDDDLATVEGQFDLIHSCIVFQHISVVRGRKLFGELLNRLRPGGLGAIHVTYAWDVHENTFGAPPPDEPPPVPNLVEQSKRKVAELLGLSSSTSTVALECDAGAVSDPAMQMYFYNLSDLTFILQRAGIARLETQLTDHDGALGAYLFFEKPA